MTWEVQAICDSCRKRSEKWHTRTTLMKNLKSVGWMKGDRAGEILCPECAYLFKKLREPKKKE